MKKFISQLSHGLLATFALITTTQAQDFSIHLKSIYEEVIEHNAKQATESCYILEEQLQTLTDNKPESIKPAFTQLIKDWKAIEATYILGDLHEDYLDTPRRIDIFRQGKEDWQTQLNRALEGKSEPKVALFKHSSRSINALEFMLFQDNHISDRERAFATHMTQSICRHLHDIEQGYQQAKTRFLTEQDKSLSYIVHSLASSIFAARDWRIGDIRGLSRKYKGKPDIRRTEYFLSNRSADALSSIFNTHQQVFGRHNQERLNAILTYYKEEKLTSNIKDNLDKIQAILKQTSTDKELFDKGEAIYQISHQLYQQYYISMVAALPIVAKVLDADGD
ncbi:imelysin family protein [Pelistega suis]|uniref:Imelysin-like domain-containing protein n=1 Tax=Pelistega suis TaxID=1631957 RepID=A0A849P8A4_9BURK|nr:imelysin family protein [Pelistega suis]NOL52223.1 hypothetical protein [Pelistega suis]